MLLAAFLTACQLPGSVDLGALGSQGLTIAGANPVDKTGVNVRGGFDFDGDGIADVAVGSSLASPLGRLQAGQVSIVFGTASPPPLVDLAQPAVPVLTIQGAAPDDRTGIWIAAGFDWNADGLDDVAVGAWLADPPGRTDAGCVYVVFGTSQPPGTLDLAAPPAGAVVKIFGAGSGDGLGLAIDAAGDLDGDGVVELVAGAPLADRLGAMDAGAAYVVKGGVPFADLLAPGPLACAIRGKAAGDQNGRAVAGRLVNGAARCIATGAQFADPLGRLDAGEVAVVPIAAPWPAVIDLTQPPPGTVFVAGPTAAGGCGITVSNAGDHDFDGLDELAAGTWRAPGPAGTGAGRADVVDLAGAPAVVDLQAVNASSLTIFGAHAGSMLGNVCGDALDADADGFPDLFAGMRSFDKPLTPNAGAAVLVRRPLGWTGPVVDLTQPPPTAHVLVGVGADDFAGYDVRSAGDVNGDGLDDLFLGALNATPLGTPNAGAAYVVFDAAPALAPKLLGLTPAAGPLAGALVDVHAENLTTLGSTQLQLGGLPVVAVDVIHSGLGRASLPASPEPGPFDATLTTPHGASSLTSAFVYKPHLMARLQGSGASGGTLTLEVLGSAGDTAWALYAFGAGPPLPVPPFGFGLVLDPATLAFLTGPHAIVQTDGLLTVVLPFPPAPQLAGAAVHLQLLVESPGGGAFSSSAQVVL